MGAYAPDMPTASEHEEPVPLTDRFLCAHPDCGKLAFRPTVLNCGHVVCMDTCAHDEHCEPLEHCPACNAPTPGTPHLCHKIHEFLNESSPGVMAEREAHVNAVMTERKRRLAGGSSSSHCEKEHWCADHSEHEEGPRFRDNSPENRQRSTLSILQQIRKNFVHHGVGCDHCGQYPIVGERYRCVECSQTEKMGFDLCGRCNSLSPEKILKRFNQNHRADHRMEKVSTQPSIMHLFQALNPEIPLSQLLRLLDMQFGSMDGGNPAGPSGSGRGESVHDVNMDVAMGGQETDGPMAGEFGEQRFGSEPSSPRARHQEDRHGVDQSRSAGTSPSGSGSSSGRLGPQDVLRPSSRITIMPRRAMGRRMRQAQSPSPAQPRSDRRLAILPIFRRSPSAASVTSREDEQQLDRGEGPSTSGS